MLQSDWLSYSHTISHHSAVAEGHPQNATFLSLFRRFGSKSRCKWIIKFLRRLKGHTQTLDFKNLKLLKNWCTHVNNCKFTKDNSIRVILLKRKVQ